MIQLTKVPTWRERVEEALGIASILAWIEEAETERDEAQALSDFGVKFYLGHIAELRARIAELEAERDGLRRADKLP